MNTSKDLIVIAIDGLAATGKGTLSRKLASEMGLAHLDTGALYRAVALKLHRQNADMENAALAVRMAQELAQDLRSCTDILSDAELRLPVIASGAATVSQIQAVRDALFDLQRDFARNPGKDFKGAVLDGRDIGTLVCPNADVKLFVTASPEIRAERRFKELQSAGKSVTKPQVLEEMKKRDARDTNRSVAPTLKADDAFELDTSDLDAQGVLDQALKIIQSKLHH